MSEPTVTFDTSRQQITIELHELPTEDAVKKISARLSKDQPRSVHIIVAMDWRDRQRPERYHPPQVPQIAKALNPSLNAFIFDAPYDSIERQSRNSVGDICDVLDTCPNLQRASLNGCSTMRGTRHEHIRELHLMGNPLDPSVVPGLAASQFPALETLASSAARIPARGARWVPADRRGTAPFPGLHRRSARTRVLDGHRRCAPIMESLHQRSWLR